MAKSKMVALCEAKAALEGAQQKVVEAVRSTYPVGTKVIYIASSHSTIFATVEQITNNGRLKLKNTITDKQRWIEGASSYLRLADRE